MPILVTGAGGFLGLLLIETILVQTDVTITALDVVPTSFASERVAATLAQVAPIEQVYHLATMVSGSAEADFDLGYRANDNFTQIVRTFAQRLKKQNTG